MLYIFKNNLLWSQGLPIVMVLVAIGAFSMFFCRPLFFVVLAFFTFSLYFFRNPERICESAKIKNSTVNAVGIKNYGLNKIETQNIVYDSSYIICPSDGKVVDVVYNKNGFEGNTCKDSACSGSACSGSDNLDDTCLGQSCSNNIYTKKVSIFLSALDVHVNWAPVSGSVKDVQYRNGTFKFAFLPKSSEFNERNDLLILADNGKTIKVRQIAGMVARRICCWVKSGDKLKAGDKYGMIRFGSRIEIFLPDSVELNVGVGQRVYGGQTILGRW